MTKRFIVVVSLLLLLSGMLSLTGCGTWRGFGQDVGRVGDKIEDKDQ